MISICVPVYEMRGKGECFLKELLDSIEKQTFKEFEVVISDDSSDNIIKSFVESSNYSFEIRYFKNEGKKGISTNLNNAIKRARFDLVKPMFQDDHFIDDGLLEEVSRSKNKWGIFPWRDSRGYQVTSPLKFHPFWLLIGRNMLGCPSGIYFQKETDLTFDENLINLMDTDFFYRLYRRYGAPRLHKTLGLEYKVWEGSVSSSIVKPELMYDELRYTQKKYGKIGLLNIYKCYQFLKRVISKKR